MCVCVCTYIHIYIYKPKGKVQRGHSQSLSSGVQCQDEKQWAQTAME